MREWIAGYSDEISARPRERITFRIGASSRMRYDVDILRIICAEDDPRGPGCNMPVVIPKFAGPFEAGIQSIRRGSYARAANLDLSTIANGDFAIGAFIYPTTPGGRRQSILSLVGLDGLVVLSLYLGPTGALSVDWREASGQMGSLSTEHPAAPNHWHFVSVQWNSGRRAIVLTQIAKAGLAASPPIEVTKKSVGPTALPRCVDVYFAASGPPDLSRSMELYNGKIDTPILLSGARNADALRELMEREVFDAAIPGVVGLWDFSVAMAADSIPGVGTIPPAKLVNLPTRAMTGWRWSGEIHNWRERPSHYRAIHFHDDDLSDAGWDADFSFEIPDDLPSGVYAARINGEGVEDHIPFVVRPSVGSTRSGAVFLFPDASYLAYANYLEQIKSPEWFEPYLGGLIELNETDLVLQQHPEFDGCLYSVHSDGSGVHFSSRLRPLLNMRPRYRSSLGGQGCGAWQFKADSHIWAWLDHMQIPVDFLCDQDLDREGVDALAGYQVVITGTHPEYCSGRMRTALEQFLGRGGRLMYLGGNGFYWKVAYDPEHPGVLELRRGESGARPWASRPGETYMAFGDAPHGLGGLWRNSGRPPNTLTGVGFTAQGFDVGAPYHRRAESYDLRARFIFAGVDDELIGDFGLVGGGAAGLEIDRADIGLGTPTHALVLASSSEHTPHYLLTVEEVLEMHPFVSGDVSDQVRADLVFWETTVGGAVFATGSIAWAGALSHHDFTNSVSRITENTLRRFLSPEPFAFPPGG